MIKVRMTITFIICVKIQNLNSRVVPQLTVLALVDFPSKIFEGTTSCACLNVFAPVYLSTGGKESITAAEIIPAGDLSPLMTRLLRHLSFLP